jgi:hypothetical protein
MSGFIESRFIFSGFFKSGFLGSRFLGSGFFGYGFKDERFPGYSDTLIPESLVAGQQGDRNMRVQYSKILLINCK